MGIPTPRPILAPRGKPSAGGTWPERFCRSVVLLVGVLIGIVPILILEVLKPVGVDTGAAVGVYPDLEENIEDDGDAFSSVRFDLM